MKLGLASIQRYEGESLLEWFAYYLIQGVDKFIIYNHNMPGAPADLSAHHGYTSSRI